ncbi:MAG: SDR family oxidoreductase [Calditrichia bacterium]
MQIKNQIVLITGSAHRVGKQIALTLAHKGAKVVLHYHSSKDAARQTFHEVKAINTEALLVQGNISHKADWLRMRDEILDSFGRIDILVNNAAIFYSTPFFEIQEKDWQKFMDINLKGAFLGSQVMGEVMIRQKKGKIINITDVSAENIWPGYIPYCISKAGVAALTKGLAKALAPHITVNAVAPGTILLADNYNEEEEELLLRKTPLQRIGDPRDIANTVLFLIEGSDFVTGTTIKVDGGRSIN